MAFENPIIMPIDVRELIAEMQEKFHLSIRQLAAICGTSPRTIYRLKKNRDLSAELIEKLILAYCRLSLKID